RPFATAIPTLAAASSGEAATGLPKEPENPIAHRRGHVSQVRSPRFQHSVHLPPEFRAIARRSFAIGSVFMNCSTKPPISTMFALCSRRREVSHGSALPPVGGSPFAQPGQSGADVGSRGRKRVPAPALATNGWQAGLSK